MLVIYVTDAREAYSKSVLRVLSSHTGSVVPLHYKRKWFFPRVWDDRSELAAERIPCLVCYLTGNDENLQTSGRAIAVRYGRVRSMEDTQGEVRIDVALDGYPLSKHVGACVDGADDAGFVEDGPRDGYFVTWAPPLRGKLGESTFASWRRIASACSELDPFKEQSFLYVEQVVTSKRSKAKRLQQPLVLRSGLYYELTLRILAPKTSTLTHTYRVEADTSVLRLMSEEELDLSRDGEEFVIEFQALVLARSSRLNLRIVPTSGQMDPQLVVPMRVEPDRFRRSLNVAGAGLSSAAVATAGLLPDTAPLAIRLTMAVAGSIGLAVLATRSG